MYSQKTIQNLKPEWYMVLGTKDKLKEQNRLKEERSQQWLNKPKPIKRGTIVIAKETTQSVTKDKEYKVMGYFATLVTTIYSSEWKEFITLKNKFGYTVKMSCRKFEIKDN